MIKTVQARMLCDHLNEAVGYVEQLRDSYIELENLYHKKEQEIKQLKQNQEEAIKYINELLQNAEAIRYLDNGEVEYRDCVFEDYQIVELLSILEKKEGNKYVEK